MTIDSWVRAPSLDHGSYDVMQVQFKALNFGGSQLGVLRPAKDPSKVLVENTLHVLPWQLQNPRTSHEGCRENHRSHGGFSSWLPEAIYLPVGIISSATFGRGKTHTFGKQLYSGFGGSSLGNTHFDTPTSATCWFHSTLLSYPFYRVFLLDDFSPGLFGQYPHRSWNPCFLARSLSFFVQMPGWCIFPSLSSLKPIFVG